MIQITMHLSDANTMYIKWPQNIRCSNPLIDAAQYSAIADTIRWCQKHNTVIPWLSTPTVQLLQNTIRPFVTNLQQWELPVANECPPAEIQNKLALPLQIPSPECIPCWPHHLFPTQGDFGRHVKSKLKSRFISSLSRDEKHRFTAVGRQSFKFHNKTHLIRPTQENKSHLWQCSMSLFSLTSFYELTSDQRDNYQ